MITTAIVAIPIAFAAVGTSRVLRAELDRLGIVSKRREGAGGRLAGGQHFSRGALAVYRWRAKCPEMALNVVLAGTARFRQLSAAFRNGIMHLTKLRRSP